MSNSDTQFKELIAQVLVRTQKMLNQSNEVLPFGLLLASNKTLEVIGALDYAENLGKTLDSIQEQMKLMVRENEYLASVIVYANYNKNIIEAYLENIENYCLKISIPVSITEKDITVLPEKIHTEDGGIYVFPINATRQ